MSTTLVSELEGPDSVTSVMEIIAPGGAEPGNTVTSTVWLLDDTKATVEVELVGMSVWLAIIPKADCCGAGIGVFWKILGGVGDPGWLELAP